MNKQAKIAAAQAILSKPNQSTSAQMAALAVLRNAQPPTLAEVFAALATIAASAEPDSESQCFSVVYKYLNAPGHINVHAESAAASVAHLPATHPVFMVLHAEQHAANLQTEATTEQLVQSWYDSDN